MSFKYKEVQRAKQIELINTTDIFDKITGGAYFMGSNREFVLSKPIHNLYAPIREDILEYFKNNKISWWRGSKPTGHILSSQIACLNHLFYIRKDRETVLKLLNRIHNEFVEVLPIPCDKDETYISFEVISGKDNLKEKRSRRGSQCTSIDAFIYARHQNGELWLIPIEWKYTEFYAKQDKSTEDRPGEANKKLNDRGNERLSRYTNLINDSNQLKTFPTYQGSVYFQEPFYQLMRQTLWAEQVILQKSSINEPLKADKYMHIHVVPSANTDLLNNIYKVSGEQMEHTWRNCLKDQSKYLIVNPELLLSAIEPKYADLVEYLRKRYWQ